MVNESNWNVYITSLYYTACVMVTVGIAPTNDPIERIYSIILMILLSVLIFFFYKIKKKGTLAYSIGTVGMIFV